MCVDRSREMRRRKEAVRCAGSDGTAYSRLSVLDAARIAICDLIAVHLGSASRSSRARSGLGREVEVEDRI